MDRKLVVVDVGCRWGFADAWQRLSPKVSLYGFDPDPEECERLRTRYKDEDVTLVAQALASQSGERTLYLTREPACSSLYRPNAFLTQSMPELACATEVGKKIISVSTLDEWAAANGIREIDFLKLDTQGAELEILRGAEKCLRSVRALEVEVEFNPIYEDQPLFGDVDAFLRSREFVLWKLSTLAHYSDHSFSGGAQNDTFFYDAEAVTRPVLPGQLFWGHAYYVRSEITVAMSDAALDRGQLARDAALMEVLGFADLSAKLSRAHSAAAASPIHRK